MGRGRGKGGEGGEGGGEGDIRTRCTLKTLYIFIGWAHISAYPVLPKYVLIGWAHTSMSRSSAPSPSFPFPISPIATFLGEILLSYELPASYTLLLGQILLVLYNNPTFVFKRSKKKEAWPGELPSLPFPSLHAVNY